MRKFFLHSLLFLVSASGLVACAHLKPQEEKSVKVDESDPLACNYLGYAFAQGDLLRDPADLVNELKASAKKLGGDHIVIARGFSPNSFLSTTAVIYRCGDLK
jgi:hypothetical protein